MPSWIETDESRERVVALAPDQNGITLHYFAYGTFIDELALKAFVLSNLLPYCNGLRFDNFRIKPLSSELFEVTANYGTKGGADGGNGSKPPGTTTLNFDTGDDKIKMTQAFAQTRFPAPGKTVVNYRGAIGIKKTLGVARAEGIEVASQAFNFTVGRTFASPDFALTGDLVGLLIALSYCVNSDQIDVTIQGIDLHFAPGELLYKGATGSQKSGGESAGEPPGWEGEVTLKFAATKNLVDVTLPGSGIEHVTKEGWDYLEIIYEEKEDANTFVPAPIQANVNQVYLRATLGVLFT